MVEAKKIVFIPREVAADERRVAAIPQTVQTFQSLGLMVCVEADAGEGAAIQDAEFTEVGAVCVTDTKAAYAQADIILSVNAPQMHPNTAMHQIDMMKDGACWISPFVPQAESGALEKMKTKQITSFSLNLIPRIARAQKMDVLSSQASVAGYKAVLLAANALNKLIPLMMTAAGTIHPSRVVVLGAGVAGLQAIATARRLGAIVEVSDVRPAVKEQVESLGATFIEVPTDATFEDKDGYAKEASASFLERQQQEVAKRIARAHIVITTAVIPGKPAPCLISASMVDSMRPGTVIVDMAAASGGNCALTQPGKTITHKNVTIIGNTNIPSLVPFHASQLFARNICSFVSGIVKNSVLDIDMKDEVIAKCLVTLQGTVQVPHVS